MNNEVLLVKRMSETATLPRRATSGAVGYDVHADLPDHPMGLRIPVGGRKMICLGIALVIPPDCYGRLADRSGLARTQGLHVLGGVVDPDYRGIVQVIIANLGDDIATVTHGQRIAQLVIERVTTPVVVETFDPLPATYRGSGGFGSTGAH